MKPTGTPSKADLVVGLHVTYGIGSGRYGQVIVAVERGGMSVVTASPRIADEVRALLDAGEKFDQWGRIGDYRCDRFTRRPDGHYRSQGSRSGSLWFGEARDYLDPSY